MDPVAMNSVLVLAVEQSLKVLGHGTRQRLAAEAQRISRTEPQSQESVRRLFEEARRRLSVAWVIGILMTTVLFVVIVSMLLTAVIVGIAFREPVYSIIFGGLSVSSLFTAIIWKPHNLTLGATLTIQRLEMVLVGLEEQWAACARIQDPAAGAACVEAANRAALQEMAKLSP